MPLKLLITGASGFIGKHLLSDHLKHDFDIRAAVRSPADLPCFTFVVGKIDGTTHWSDAVSGFDAVIHLAAYAHVTNPAKIDKALLQETNVQGTARLAQEAAKAGVKHFIFISSIGAMADSSNTILFADAPCKPTTLYGQSKLMAEKELKSIAGKHGMDWTIIRPPLVYGPGNPGNMQRLLKLIRSGIPLPLASVRNRRSFVYVENLVDVIVACLGNPKAFGKTYLPSDGEDVSTPELIRKIAKANQSFQFSESSKQGAGRSTLGSRRTLRLFPFPESILKTLGCLPGLGALRKLTSSLYVDSEPVREDLGWSPRFTMDEGVVKTLGG
jgi:nucleoside-diphosphate-sugar epimerase